MKKTVKNVSWVSTLYFMQGLPYAIVLLFPVVLYKNLHLSNAHITFLSSILLLPWVFKPLWSPFLETVGTKRGWVVGCQSVFCLLFILLGLSMNVTAVVPVSFILFLVLAFTSATHDMTSDGLYLTSLDTTDQMRYVGVRTLCYQLARLSCQGGLLVFIGYWMTKMPVVSAWEWGYTVLAAVVSLLFIWHVFRLPRTETRNANVMDTTRKPYQNLILAWREFFKIRYVVLFLMVMFLFNFPEALLLKVVPLFLLDTAQKGGLQLSSIDVGYLLGTVGVFAMMLGVLVSGWWIARSGLRRLMPVLLALVVLLDAVYIVLAWVPHVPYRWVLVAIALSQFGFGVGNGAYMSYILKKVAHCQYKMTCYAIATAIMAMGMAIPQAISGALQVRMGYAYYFMGVLGVGMLVVIFIWRVVRYDDTLSL